MEVLELILGSLKRVEEKLDKLECAQSDMRIDIVKINERNSVGNKLRIAAAGLLPAIGTALFFILR